MTSKAGNNSWFPYKSFYFEILVFFLIGHIKKRFYFLIQRRVGYIFDHKYMILQITINISSCQSGDKNNIEIVVTQS